MASFVSTLWQPDDEITSEKLNQMAQNEEYLNQYTVQSQRLNNFATDPTYGNPLSSNLRGRTYGSFSNTKRVSVFAAFDWNLSSPVNDVWFMVNFPNVFTQAPVCVATIASGQPNSPGSPGIPPMVCGIGADFYTDKVLLMVRYVDNHADTAFQGCVHLMAEGT